MDHSTKDVSKWVEWLSGAGEAELRRDAGLLASVFRQDASGRLVLRHRHSGQEYVAGRLEIASIGSLRSAHGSSPGGAPVPLTLVTRGGSSIGVQHVDVACVMAAQEDDGALFQVASNFNTLEAISEKSSPETPTFLTHYVYDLTQGPAASLAAGAAALARGLCAFRPWKTEESSGTGEDDALSWTQTDTRQVNLLKEVAAHYPVKNGYVLFERQTSLPDMPAVDSAEWDELLCKVSVAAHRQAQVCFVDGKPARGLLSHGPLVDQMFVAAVNMQQGSSGSYNRRVKDAVGRARLILRAAYEGTYLMARATGRRRIYLTMVGGGVFGNPGDVILEELARAHRLYSAGLDSVQLLLYSPHYLLPSPVPHPYVETIRSFSPLNTFPIQWKHFTSDTTFQLDSFIL